MLSVKGLSAGYGRKTVLRSIDVDALEPGTVTAFLGQNGAGKSTLLRSLAGLHKAEGNFALFDADITRQSAAQRARQITYMPQSLPHSVALTVLEATIGALRASSRDPDAVKRSLAVLDRLGIQSLAMSQLDSLSGRQRQLASLAQALVRKPQVLLLDEPTSALDVAHQIRVMRTIKEITRGRISSPSQFFTIWRWPADGVSGSCCYRAVGWCLTANPRPRSLRTCSVPSMAWRLGSSAAAADKSRSWSMTSPECGLPRYCSAW